MSNKKATTQVIPAIGTHFVPSLTKKRDRKESVKDAYRRQEDIVSGVILACFLY